MGANGFHQLVSMPNIKLNPKTPFPSSAYITTCITICNNPSNILKTHSAPSVTVSDMEVFFGPFAEIKILEENLMGPEAEQVQRFKVTH